MDKKTITERKTKAQQKFALLEQTKANLTKTLNEANKKINDISYEQLRLQGEIRVLVDIENAEQTPPDPNPESEVVTP